MTAIIGFGARAVLPPEAAEQVGKSGNLTAPVLAEYLGGGAGITGGDLFTAFVAAVAFATILAVVAGLVLSASGAVAHRAARAHESVRAMRSLWREEAEPFDGTFFRWPAVESNPKPVQKPGVPIVVAGSTEIAAKRAARYGDGFYPRSAILTGSNPCSPSCGPSARSATGASRTSRSPSATRSPRASPTIRRSSALPSSEPPAT
jgi:hypothetical protein